jgi:uncharacterized protein (TIGR04255 family)
VKNSNVYQHPPITEAVIGINFAAVLSESDKEELKARLSTHYSVIQPIENLSLNLEIGIDRDKQKTANTQLVTETAYRLGTPDMSELVMLLPRTVVIAQIAPYPGWDHFYGRFVRDWKLIRRVLGFREISRIGARYINRIDIPIEGSVVHHENYLDLYPKITDKFGPLTAYAVQAKIFMEDIKCNLTVNSAAVPSPLLNTSSFLLDQDISRELDVPQTDEGIFDLLNQIRVRKNEVFESSVTNKARSLFEHV